MCRYVKEWSLRSFQTSISLDHLSLTERDSLSCAETSGKAFAPHHIPGAAIQYQNALDGSEQEDAPMSQPALLVFSGGTAFNNIAGDGLIFCEILLVTFPSSKLLTSALL